MGLHVLAQELRAFLEKSDDNLTQCREFSNNQDTLTKLWQKKWDGDYTVYTNIPLLLASINAGGERGTRDRFGDGSYYDGDKPGTRGL